MYQLSWLLDVHHLVAWWVDDLSWNLESTSLNPAEWTSIFPVSCCRSSSNASLHKVLVNHNRKLRIKIMIPSVGSHMLSTIEAIHWVGDIAAGCQAPVPQPTAQLLMAMEIDAQQLLRRVASDPW